MAVPPKPRRPATSPNTDPSTRRKPAEDGRPPRQARGPAAAAPTTPERKPRNPRGAQAGYESGFSVEDAGHRGRHSGSGPEGSNFGRGDTTPDGSRRPARGSAAPRQRGDVASAAPAQRPAASTAPAQRKSRGDGPRHDGGYAAPQARIKPIAELEVERARKMRVRHGSEKQEQIATQLREKRVDHDHIAPLRLQKALALSGVGSRRDCDEWVAAGRVSVDGRISTPGTRVEPGQTVRFDGKIIQIKWPDRLPRIVLYHKQEGELVSRDDPEGRTTVFERLPKVQGSAWVAIGRLDFNTSGLLVFTTSGDLANRMMHPSFEVEREYAVRVLGTLLEDQRKALVTGIELDDGLAKFQTVEDHGGEGKNHWYRVILREGRNREVRRMFEHFELTVSRLMRVRFGILSLPSRLKRGQYYELDEPEVLSVLKWAGLGLTGRAQA